MVVLLKKNAAYHVFLFLIIVFVSFPAGLFAASSSAQIDQAREYYKRGRYTDCLSLLQSSIAEGPRARDLLDKQILMGETLMVLGRYEEAAAQLERVLLRSPSNMQVLNLLHRAYLYSDLDYYTPVIFKRIYDDAISTPVGNWSPSELVAMGRSLLDIGFDPRSILEQVYGYAVRRDPNCRDVYLAMGDLALDKQDYELAAEQFRKGLSRFGDDPDLNCGLARAFYNSNRAEMLKSLDAAFSINPNHPSSWLLLAEHQIDSEDYSAAKESLGRVLGVNPALPEAWAFNSVLAYMANDTEAAMEYHNNALKPWADNPNVDYLVGKKLSQKYRFAEGAEYQRKALQSDPNFLPARIQLAQDLLRLGSEERGWELAEEVHRKDKYNIQAYNLVSLRDHMATFATLQDGQYIVRMDKKEAAIYGRRVLEFVKRAVSEVSEKYGIKLDNDIIVELFPEQQDFSVRTFGIPGGDGYLGVCFGNVITANSPKLERLSNWEATLWHEVCHVVTLNMTNNKMPRWVSEGISVYEESQKNPTWGQQMNSQYRNKILEDKYFKISELSAAFLSPSSTLDLMFAYYQSSLVVEFLVKEYGYDSLRAILASLADGGEINQALSEHAAPIDKLDRDFSTFIRERAESLAPKVDWEEPTEAQSIAANPEMLATWLTEHPDSFWALTFYAKNLIAEEKLEEAKEPLNKLLELYPEYTGVDNAYQLLAGVYRSLGETQQEEQCLEKLANLSAEAVGAYDRLMDIAAQQRNWQKVVENGKRYFAVYPMPANLYRRLAIADEGLGNDAQAIESYQCLLELDPVDPADVNYKLGRLLVKTDPQKAKRYILTALSEAPRFRDAQSLLLQIVESEQGTSEAAPDNRLGSQGTSISNVEAIQ